MTAPLPEGTFGNFEILSRLGRGGMAEVYRARVRTGPRAGRVVAIKRLLPEVARDPANVALFTHEADLSLALSSPSVVQTLEVGVHDGSSFIVMELIDGTDLGQILRRCKQRAVPLPIDFGVFLSQALLEALAYAHTARNVRGEPLGLVHCDVSPSNVFISRTGEIKLGDFGVARARVGPQGQQAVTGKPHYLSPEVLAGEIAPAADLWAANVVLYESLTLERPFTGASFEQVLEAVRQRRYRPVRDVRPEVSEGLAAIVDRGFAAQPEARFAWAADFARALEAHYDERIGTPLAIAAVVRGLFGAEG